MQYPGTDAGSSGPHWGEKEQTVSIHVLLMIGIKVSYSLGILASVDNPVSCAQADGNGNMSSVLIG